jgi:hypothetical protein
MRHINTRERKRDSVYVDKKKDNAMTGLPPVRDIREIISTLPENRLPVFIAILRNDQDIEANIIKLESLAACFLDKMDVYYALEDMHPYFAHRYGTLGTPTYLIVHQGNVLGTILGNNSNPKLVKHASYILLNNRLALPKDDCPD